MNVLFVATIQQTVQSVPAEIISDLWKISPIAALILGALIVVWRLAVKKDKLLIMEKDKRIAQLEARDLARDKDVTEVFNMLIETLRSVRTNMESTKSWQKEIVKAIDENRDNADSYFHQLKKMIQEIGTPDNKNQN